MQNKHIFIVILSAIVLFFFIRFAFFEQVRVSDLKWSQSFAYDSEDPYGANVFYRLLENRYGKENIFKNHIDTLITKIESSDNLYISISRNRYLSYEKQEELKRFIAKGNSALVISSQYYPNLNSSDSTYVTSTNYQEHDSIFRFTFSAFEDTLVYKNYNRSGDRATSFYPNTFTINESEFYETLATEDTTSIVFFKSVLDTGAVYRHVLPQLFSNIASVQDFYLPHFTATFNYLDGKTIILDHPSFDNSYDESPTESYLEYILNSRSLKWAYYTFLFTTIGFLLFRGKRKQRVIPIPEKNENTSIQYVDTLSDLFEKQGQNEKLVPHLESVFFHKVKQKYYLAPDNERFVELLSKKSRIPENQIDAILNYFNTGKGIYDFSDDQLIMLYKRLDDFYNNAE